MINTEIVRILELMGKGKSSFFPVTLDGELVGAIDMNNISEFILLYDSE